MFSFFFSVVIYLLFLNSHQGDGPIAIVLAPTRELVQQIGREVKSYATQYGMQVAVIYGGGSRYEQSKVLKAGCEVIVATPGRLLDFLKDKVRWIGHGSWWRVVALQKLPPCLRTKSFYTSCSPFRVM